MPGSIALRAAGVFAVAAAAAAAASSLIAGGSSPAGGAPGATVAEIHAVPPAEAASFAVLRRAPRPSDGLVALHAGSGPLGADPALARTLVEPRGGLSLGIVSVVPANGAVCLRVPFAVDAAQWWCQPLARARRGELLMALRPAGPLRAGEQLLVGLVPDGVRAVTVIAAGGVRRSVAVRWNVYDVQLDAPHSVVIDVPGVGARRYLAP